MSDKDSIIRNWYDTKSGVAIAACWAVLWVSILIFVSACAPGIKAHNPGQAVYLAIGADFMPALRFADEYQVLPDCVTHVISPNCSDPAVRAKVQAAKEAGWIALQQAETAVRDPNFNGSTEAAVLATAKAGFAALTTILAQLEAQGYKFK